MTIVGYRDCRWCGNTITLRDSDDDPDACEECQAKAEAEQACPACDEPMGSECACVRNQIRDIEANKP